MKFFPLSKARQAATGMTHGAIVTHEDLTESTVNTAQAVTLAVVPEGSVVSDAILNVITPLEDASDVAFNSNAVTVGDTDADRLIASAQVNANGSTVTAKVAASTIPFVYTAEATIALTVGSMAAKALSDIDTGELEVLIKLDVA